MGRLTWIVVAAAIVVAIIGCGDSPTDETTTTSEVTFASLGTPNVKDDVPPSERCRADKLINCKPTSACLIKFGIDPDDPDGWDQPDGWIACLKQYGASQKIIDQYRSG
jgi:hypothetical protein